MMKRLLHYELKKLCKDKVVLALVVLALILQCLLTFFALDNGDKPDTEIMKRAYDLYSNDRELFETRKGELEKAIVSNDGEINALMFEYYAIVSAETDAGLPQDYRKEIDALIKNAKRQADEYESIGVPEKAYSRKSFSNTVEIYTPLRDADIKYEYVHGWDKYFSLDFVNVFILALVVLITARIMSYEKISNSASVVNTTANGVNTFYASKLIIAFTVAAASAILLSLVSILQTALTLGFSSASNSVHVLEAFRLAPFECGILGLLIKSFLLKLLCAIGVAALTVFVYSVTRSSAFAVLISGAVIGADFVFELRGGLRFLTSSENSLARYYPISIFNRCFDLVVVSVSAVLVITILLFVFAFKVLCRIRNVGTPKAKINLPRLRMPKNRFTFELYKLNIKEKAVLIIILALAVHAAVCFAAYIPDDSSTEYFYKKYSERFCGEVDYSKMADIQAEYNLQVYYSMLDIREIDESTSAEERDAINKNIVLSAYKLPAIEHVLSNARRVSTLSGAELIYDSGWNELFSSDFDYIFVLTAVLITALFITRERESEAIYVVGTTRFGRRARITRQIAAVVITMTIFYIASSAISAAVFVSRYELPSGGALLKSLEYFSLADGLTINEYCIFAAVSIFVKVLFTVLLISGAALIIKRFYMSFAVCFAVVYIPFLAMKMNLEKINRFTVGGQLSFGPLMSASTDHPSTYLIVSTLIYCAICVLPLAYLAIRGKRDT